MSNTNLQWRIIHKGGGWYFPYVVQYKMPGAGHWEKWRSYETRIGARLGLWRAKRQSKPVGKDIVVFEEPQKGP